MKNMNKREIRKYCKTFKHKLPYVPKEKKRFTDSINTSIKAFLVEHPFATLEDIHREFGTKSVRRTKLLCGLAGIIAIALILFCVYFVYEVRTSAPKEIHIYTIIESETQEE